MQRQQPNTSGSVFPQYPMPYFYLRHVRHFHLHCQCLLQQQRATEFSYSRNFSISLLSYPCWGLIALHNILSAMLHEVHMAWKGENQYTVQKFAHRSTLQTLQVQKGNLFTSGKVLQQDTFPWCRNLLQQIAIHWMQQWPCVWCLGLNKGRRIWRTVGPNIVT